MGFSGCLGELSYMWSNLVVLVLFPGLLVIVGFIARFLSECERLVFLCSLFVLFSVLCNIFVLFPVKLIDSIYVTCGLYMYSLLYGLTDIVHELYGYNYALRVVKIGLYAVMVYILTLVLLSVVKPVQYGTFYGMVTSLNIRVLIASVMVYFLSNYLDVYVFEKLKRVTGGKHLWLRNICGELCADIFDTVLFFTCAFYGVWSTKTLLKVITGTLIGKWIYHIADTPFIYISLKTITTKHKTVHK